MNNIENTYVNYDELLEKVEEDVIKDRITQPEDDTMAYVNEKFLLSRLTSFMLGDDINIPLIDERRKAFKNYLDTLYYHLKFRKCDPQALELMLLAFEAGRLIPHEKQKID